MADHEFYDSLNQFQATRSRRRWWPKAIVICAVIGGVYGAALSSAINTTAGAIDVIGIAAAVMAVLCGVPGAQVGFLLGEFSLRDNRRSENALLNRLRSGRLLVGMFAAMGGAILGGFLGVLAVMPLGVILGAVGGWFFTGAILLRGFFTRLLGRVLGLVLGACIGAIILALQRDQTAALVAIAWGVGLGAVVGPLPLLLFAKLLDSLASERHAESKIIDATVVDVPHDEIEGPPDDDASPSV